MIRRALLFFLCIALTFVANGLVLKDDYRSPRNPERRNRKRTTLIILHTTEAHAKSSLNKLSERGEAHYCVVENGTVYRIIDRDKEAFHAGRSMWNGREDCDEYTIGIEVVGHHDKPVTLAQLEAIKELVSQLQNVYKLKDSQVVCHSHVAYGAPNKWHKKKHRGRKRCGMLFAMPSVRSKLDLATRPALDPDIKAKRLVQGDEYLSKVLYGSVDTMRKHYSVKGKAKSIAKSVNAKKVSTNKPPPKEIKIKKGELKKHQPTTKADGDSFKKGKLIKTPKNAEEKENEKSSKDIEKGSLREKAKLIKK